MLSIFQLGLIKLIFKTLGTPSAQQWPEFHSHSYSVEWEQEPGMPLEQVLIGFESHSYQTFLLTFLWPLTTLLPPGMPPPGW